MHVTPPNVMLPLRVRAALRHAWLGALVVLSLGPATTPPADAAARDILVSSRNTHSVRRYDGDTGAYLGDFVDPGEGNLSTPQEVRYGPDGQVYVTGFGNRQIKKYDALTSDWLGNFTSGYLLGNPTKTTFGPDSLLYVSQWAGTKTVARFDAYTGDFVDEFTPAVNNGMAHAWDADGNLTLAVYGDGANGNVLKFDPSGAPLGEFIDSSLLQGPVNLWFDGNELRVVDWTRGTIERFDTTSGAWLGTLVSGLTNAEGYTFGPDGLLYVCDWTANVVNRYHPDGTLETAAFISDPGLVHPNSIVFMPEAPVGVGALPAGGTRLRVAPNPFRPRTRIEFEVLQPGPVRLAVFDAGGRRVATLVDGVLPAGMHAAEWEAKAAPPGLYFTRLESAGEVLSGKLTRLR